MKFIILFAAVALSACTQAQVSETQTGVTTACALVPVLATSASAAVKSDVATACADEQVLAPVVAPLIPAPAAK